MREPRLRQAASRSLLIVAILLSGCGQHQAAAPPSSVPAASSATLSAASPAAVPTSGSATTSTALEPSPDPAVPNPLAAPRLALDQPWVWSGDASCQHRGGALLAVGPQGQLTQFDQPVAVTIERPGQPPLIITCGDDGSFAVIDPNDWSHRSLTLPAGSLLNPTVAWSPDGQTFVLAAMPHAPEAGAKQSAQLYQVDLQRGDVRFLLDQLGGEPIGDWPEPVAWGAGGLIVRVQSSATSVFWQLDVNQQPVAARELLTIGHTGGWAVDPQGRLLAHQYLGAQPLLRDLATGTERELTGGSTPAIAPDGARIAYLVAEAGTCCVLRIERPDGREPMTVALTPEPGALLGTVTWAANGTRLLVLEGPQIVQGETILNVHHARLWVVRSDGMLLGSAVVQQAETLRLAADDHVLVSERGNPPVLTRLPLDGMAGNSFRFPLPGDAVVAPRLVYLPETLWGQVGLSDIPVSATPTQAAPQEVVWYGVHFSPPPDHYWEPATVPPPIYDDAPVLAQGRIVFIPTPDTHPVEQPEGMTLMIVAFSGTADDWLARVRASAPAENPIDPASVRTTTLAGLPALAYSHVVIGVSRREQLVVPLGDDRLLLIGVSNADYVAYAATLSAMAVDHASP